MTEGERVIWLHQPRGGYGSVWEVPGVVEHVGAARVTISVQTKRGEWVQRKVRPENLRPVTTGGAQ